MRSRLIKGEKIKFIGRQHWIVLLYPLSLGGGFLALIYNGLYNTLPTLCHIISFFSIVLLVFPALKIRSNILVISDKRIIDEFGSFNYTRQCRLDKIVDVSYTQSFIGASLNFGRMIIKTDIPDGIVVAKFISNPEKVKKELNKCIENFSLDEIEDLTENKDGSDANTGNVSIADELTKLMDLKEKGALSEDEFSELKRNLMLK